MLRNVVSLIQLTDVPKLNPTFTTTTQHHVLERVSHSFTVC